MIDKTILELTDRVAAYAVRATKAEVELEKWKGQSALNLAQLSEARQTIEKLNAEIEDLKATVKAKESTVSYYWKETKRLEEELKKHDET